MKVQSLFFGILFHLVLLCAWIPFASAGSGLKAWPLLDPAQRFVLYGPNQDLVFDRTTGLLWERSPSGTTNRNWTNSIDRCIEKMYPAAETPGATRGWRLPTVEELSSLQALVRVIPPSGPAPNNYEFAPASNLFQNVSGAYWTSTTYPFSGVLQNGDQAYIVNFGVQSSHSQLFIGRKHEDSSAKSWCVYGGSNPITPVQFIHTP